MSDNYLLEKHNFKMQKKYGQNFLTDVRIPARIAEGCTDFDVSDGKRAESLILEVGPGAGILTKELAKRFSKVLAVEIDTELIPILEESLAGYNNITVVNRDVMQVELAPLLAEYRQQDGKTLPVSVCANLPYYITTPVLMKLLEEYGEFSFITVMVQKEVARRLCAKQGSDDYGAITAAIGLYGKAVKLFDVSAGNFNPKPKVDSSVVKISIYEPARYSKDQIEKASKVIKAAFSMRRKTLVNTLMSLCIPSFDTKEKLGDLVESLFGNRNVRGEELSTDQFVVLAEKLYF
ncbi:MAG: ribosomal RNA small subunit methyltransferase A [Clostridia bacterium]|nr:ribosomal RNA small subunit methyltransferase A [Clostridia bacterium]